MTNRNEAPRLSAATRQRIEEGIKNWQDPNSAARKRFVAVEAQFDSMLQPLEDAIVASERLTEDDFAIRINARD